jgi:hypothetical protein
MTENVILKIIWRRILSVREPYTRRRSQNNASVSARRTPPIIWPREKGAAARTALASIMIWAMLACASVEIELP